MNGSFAELWPHALWLLTLSASLAASVHVIFTKGDVRSAVAWVSIIWLVPLVGATLYVLLGINRIKRRAMALRAGHVQYHPAAGSQRMAENDASGLEGQFASLARLVGEVVPGPLLGGNQITTLVNGDEAYREMLGAIDTAGYSVALSTYIFDKDRAGSLFVKALTRAVARGVEVRVLVDDMGARYSWTSVTGVLRASGVETARFLPTLLPWRLPFINLRNHRKILVVDGRVGFTGGMNIRAGHMLMDSPRKPVQDVHFMVEGPVVSQLMETFAADWHFAAGEQLEGDEWYPPLEPRGAVLARGIADGPDEDFDKLIWTVQGALACAKSSVRIVTPYFLPDSSLIWALNIAVRRGVEVDIVLPGKNNLPVVKWASTHLLHQLVEHGCRIWLTPPPFDHTKLMLVDGMWSLFGSANWDPRSFLLNFEFNLECYDRGLAEAIEEVVEAKLKKAVLLTGEQLRGRSFPVKLRDGAAWLLSPYL